MTGPNGHAHDAVASPPVTTASASPAEQQPRRVKSGSLWPPWKFPSIRRRSNGG